MVKNESKKKTEKYSVPLATCQEKCQMSEALLKATQPQARGIGPPQDHPPGDFLPTA